MNGLELVFPNKVVADNERAQRFVQMICWKVADELKNLRTQQTSLESEPKCNLSSLELLCGEMITSASTPRCDRDFFEITRFLS